MNSTSTSISTYGSGTNYSYFGDPTSATDWTISSSSMYTLPSSSLLPTFYTATTPRVLGWTNGL